RVSDFTKQVRPKIISWLIAGIKYADAFSELVEVHFLRLALLRQDSRQVFLQGNNFTASFRSVGCQLALGIKLPDARLLKQPDAGMFFPVIFLELRRLRFYPHLYGVVARLQVDDA